MAILKLRPHCVNTIWGGTKLREEYGISYDGPNLAEAWMLSCHPDGPCYVENGPHAGKTLAEYIEQAGKRVLGNCGLLFAQFPILIKYIDAQQNLSVQVHPSNLYAIEHEKQYGKTEMWYILDAQEGAYLYLGLKHEITQEEFEQRIASNTLLEVLHKQYVHKGECYFIPSGTLHAIGQGILIAEIQQNSNVTYRIYDYGRLGPDGKPRSLQIAQAKEVAKLCPANNNFNFGGHLTRCQYFTVDDQSGAQHGVCDDESFTSLLILEGEGMVSCGSEAMPIKKGDSLFLPADSGEYLISGDCHCLCTRVGTI